VFKRAVACTAVFLGVHGFSSNGAQDQAAAARTAQELTLPVNGKEPMEPVKTLVNALLRRLHSAPVKSLRPGPVPLLRLLYRLESARVSGPSAEAPTLLDLAAREFGGGAANGETWLPFLLDTLGQLPPGTRVRLPDGRVGLVLEPATNGSPMTPKVLAGGRVVSPAASVQLLPR
jgi:hypothetical protein